MPNFVLCVQHVMQEDKAYPTTEPTKYKSFNFIKDKTCHVAEPMKFKSFNLRMTRPIACGAHKVQKLQL